MPTAELIAIGTELLLGEINDTNTQYLARQLRDCGIDLYRSTTIGDNLQRITELMQESLSRADIVITTGGLGPTVDDPTREAAGLAFKAPLEFHPELWEQIKQRFLKRAMNVSENNKKQAYIPLNATVIENPVGTAPSFILHQNGKTLVCLPGVPREMEFLTQSAVIPWLKAHYPLAGVIKARVLHVGAVSESKVDELVGDFEKMDNPTVGLLAHPGIVDIRITAKADSIAHANHMIEELENIIRQRLPDDIFGADEDTLSSVLQNMQTNSTLPSAIVSSGFSPESNEAFRQTGIPLEILAASDQSARIQDLHQTGKLVLSCVYDPTPEMAQLRCGLNFNNRQDVFSREYMGAPGLREEWAKNFALSYFYRKLRSLLIEETNDQS